MFYLVMKFTDYHVWLKKFYIQQWKIILLTLSSAKVKKQEVFESTYHRLHYLGQRLDSQVYLHRYVTALVFSYDLNIIQMKHSRQSLNVQRIFLTSRSIKIQHLNSREEVEGHRVLRIVY